MKIKEMYTCDNCNETFESKEECEKHELKCKPYLPIIYCYLINKNNVPENHENLKYSQLIFTKSIQEDDGYIILWDTCKEKFGVSRSLSNCVENIDIIKNNRVEDNGLYVYVLTFDNSVENQKACLQKLIDYRINELNKQKKETEEYIKRYKNCKIDFMR